MKPSEKPIFVLEIGGFFQGRSELSIIDSGDALQGEIAPPWGRPARHFAVGEDDLLALRDCLARIGIDSWRERYERPVLDGTSWELEYDGRAYSGWNAYPEGFRDLQAFLADRFGFGPE